MSASLSSSLRADYGGALNRCLASREPHRRPDKPQSAERRETRDARHSDTTHHTPHSTPQRQQTADSRQQTVRIRRKTGC
eukprot:scaffold1361_cov156-Isochrysis_galbana.AAC.1